MTIDNITKCYETLAIIDHHLDEFKTEIHDGDFEDAKPRLPRLIELVEELSRIWPEDGL